MKKLVPVSLIAASLSWALAAPSDLVETCGLKGSLSKRLAACAKVAGKDAERRFVYISPEMQSNPLGGIGADSEVVWRLVSRFENGTQVWLNEGAKKFWAATKDSHDLPIADETLQAALKFCAELKLSFTRKNAVSFELPSVAAWAQALEFNFGNVERSMYDLAVGYSEGQELAVIGDSKYATAASVVCVSK